MFLDTANKNVDPGDTGMMRGGTYNIHIFPGQNGTELSRISYIAYDRETPVINNNKVEFATYYYGIALRGRSYITVSGVTVDSPQTKGPRLNFQRLE